MGFFPVEKRTQPKVSIQIGSLFDIPTATILTGKRGETIINGGVGHIMGIIGNGNTFKSMITNYMMLQAANRVIKSSETSLHTYDTEVNTVLERLESFAKPFENLPKDIIFSDEPLWSITDKSQYSGEEWAGLFNDNIAAKIKDKKNVIKYTALRDPYTKKELTTLAPGFITIDSLTDFEPTSTMEMADNIENDDGSTNMRHMQKGRFTDNFLSTLPAKTANSNTYMFLTAQTGEKKDMGGNKYNKPPKTLQHMSDDSVIKGVSPKFAFLTFGLWRSISASVLKNPTTKRPLYPNSTEDNLETDLNVIKLKMIRSKRGASGYVIEILASQTEGVKPTLTEFHNIKTAKQRTATHRYGITGNDRNYQIVFRPDVNLSNNTIRQKIDADPLLRRAINIASEMLQLGLFFPGLKDVGLLCTPEELYEDIKKLGYDWDVLLNTRGYMLPDQYNKNELPFLSTIDLLKMRKEIYTPYWMEKK